jgi:hypothetical protein
MNTTTGYIRINLTIPKEIVEHLKRHTDNMSKYFMKGGWKNSMARSCCSISPDGRNNFASAVFYPKEAWSHAIW